MVKSLKKYRLINSEGKDFPGPCAFYMTERGCRSGSLCKFSHNDISNASPGLLSSLQNSSSSQNTSTESERSDIDIFMPPSSMKLSNNKDISSPSTSDYGIYTQMAEIMPDPDIVQYRDPAQPPFHNITSFQNREKSKRQNDTNNMENLSYKKVATKSSPAKKTEVIPINQMKKQKHNDLKKKLKLNLPVAPFSTRNIKPSVSYSDSEKYMPIPRSSPEGLKWRGACIATRSHECYEHLYNFEHYRQKDVEHCGTTEWVHARPYGKWCEDYPQAIAIDCEMCETNDPITGVTDGKALCRVSIINASNPEEILLDSLVKPQYPIIDDRFRIHGIHGSSLENVQFTLKHAQKFLKALCSEETVIIGHAVHNDLVALKLIHHCVVDSSLLFTIRDQPNAACSLKDLSMTILGKKMSEIHDSVQDSRISLLCLEVGYIGTNGNPQSITRSISTKRAFYTEQKKELLVHRIPTSCNVKHIKNMFLVHTYIQPVNVKDIEFKNSKTGRTIVEFPTEHHANLAFTTLAGEKMTDATGKYQKRVYLNNGGYVQVRKMIKD